MCVDPVGGLLGTGGVFTFGEIRPSVSPVFLCLPLVCAVSVLHILFLWWLKLSSQWKSTHWVQGFVTSCFCLVFDSSTVVAEHGFGTKSGGVTAT